MDTTILTTTYFIIMVPAVALQIRQSGAVTKSAQKFVLTTYCLVLFAIMTVLATLITSMKVMSDEYTFASFWGCIIGIDLWHLHLLMRDNNWFNDQWKKLKKNIKNLHANLKSMFTPAPAPG